MTQLGSISGNHLSLTCKVCSTHKMLPVEPLIDRLGWEARLQDVVPNLRCSRCKAKGQAELQIVFVGGFEEAMLGAMTAKDPMVMGRVKVEDF